MTFLDFLKKNKKILEIQNFLKLAYIYYQTQVENGDK